VTASAEPRNVSCLHSDSVIIQYTRSESAGKSDEFKSSLRAGEEAPDFELPTLLGERVRLSALRGKKHILLEFGSIT